MPEYLSPTSSLALAAAIAVAAGASALGVFMVIQRMALVADAFSHVALPGVAAGILLHFSPALGALAMLLLGVMVITRLETARRIAPETTLGAIFTASLALGLLLIPDESVLEALFGDVSRLSPFSAVISVVGGVVLAACVFFGTRPFALMALSRELAHASDVPVRRTRLLFFLAIAFAVALGIQFMGVLLVSALVILPAASARNIAASFRGMFPFSISIAIGAILAGLFAAERFSFLPGPTVVVALAAVFALSLAARMRE